MLKLGIAIDTVASSRFRPEDYVFPATMEEAISILSSEGEKARIIAGGTMLFELAERKMIPEVKKLVDLSRIGLSYVASDPEAIRIGSLTTLSELTNHETIGQTRGIGALTDSLSWIRPIQVKNVATVGGEICSATPLFDLPPALIALNAKLILVGPNGSRTTDLDGFVLDYLLCDLRQGELLKEVVIPRPKKGSGSTFTKLERTANDFALLNCGVALELDKEAKCRSACVCLGGALGAPSRLSKVENKLVKTNLSRQDIEKAAEFASEVQMSQSVQASSAYKKSVAKIICRDTILSAKERALDNN